MDDDRFSEISQLSDADRLIFTALSNAERVDLTGLPDREPRIVELPTVTEEEPLPPRPETPPPVRSPVRTPPRSPVRSPPPRSPVRTPPRSPVRTPPRSPVRTPPPRSPVRTPPRSPAHVPEVMPETSSVDDEETRRTVLLDLRALELQGVQLSKQWSMEDSTSDMMLELRRLTLAMDETSNVTMMRDALRIAVTGIEVLNNRIGLLDLDGWSNEVCRDLNRYNAPLSRIYRKWWRRSTSVSPEADICMSLASSMGFYHMKRKMSKQMMSGLGGGGASSSRGGGFRRAPRNRPSSPPSSDDEAPPE